MQTVKTALALFAALLAAPAYSQDETEAPREYNVEVIVFVYEEEVSVGNEVFLPEPPPEVVDFAPFGAGIGTGPDAGTEALDGADAIRPAGNDPGRITAGNEIPAETAATAEDDAYLPDFVITPVDELGMIDIIDRLERLDVYNTVLHAAWTQPALPREQSITMDLSMLTEPPTNLTGHFELYLSRFLHLAVDLTLDNGDRVPVAIDVPERAFLFEEEPSRQPGVIHYQIKDDRIFKNGDTRYFDHPRFGVIARVTRIEEPEEDEEDAESGDAVALDDVTGDEVVE